MIKIFGVGNILLCDDGVGVRVVKELKEKILNLNKYYKKYNNEIEVIIGENDYLYCLENINEDDFIIIVDGTYFMIRPGSITVKELRECDELLSGDFIGDLSEHEESFLKSVRRDKSNIEGYLIGIEIGKIDYSVSLSKEIDKQFDLISLNVFNKIEEIISQLYVNTKSF